MRVCKQTRERRREEKIQQHENVVQKIFFRAYQFGISLEFGMKTGHKITAIRGKKNKNAS